MNRLNVLVGQGIPRSAAPKVSGMMEVIAPEDGFVLETRLPLLRNDGLGRTDLMKEQKNRHNGKLHVFGPEASPSSSPSPAPASCCSAPPAPPGRLATEGAPARSSVPAGQLRNRLRRQAPQAAPQRSSNAEEVIIEPVQTVPRMGCGNESTNRPYTPSKQIMLCTAKSLERRNALLPRTAKTKKIKMNIRRHDCIEEETDESMKNSRIDGRVITCEDYTELQRDNVDKQNSDEKPPDSSDDEDGGELKMDETRKRTAPLQLMGEFLKAIMERKYSLAKKLCQMILIYEPQNPEAKQFLPLIERKQLLESEQDDKEDEETSEGSSDESEETTNSSENSETESEASSDDSEKIFRNLEVP